MGDWTDVFLFAADPSGSLYATKKTAEEAARRLGSGGGKAPAQSGDGGAQSTAPAVTCCNEYQLEGEFLLNTKTGAVWQFDKAAKTFVWVPKQKSALQKAAMDLLFKLDYADTEDKKATALAGVHHSERDAIAKSYDALVKLAEAEIKK